MTRVLLQCVTALEHITDRAAAVDLRLRLGLLAHLQLLPLGLVDEQLTGLGTLEGADNAPLLHLIHQTGGAGIAQLQAALEHGDGGLSRFQNHLHGSGQQLIAVLLRFGGFGSWTASDAVVLFFDASFAQGSNGRYVTNVENDPFGSAFAQAKDDDGTLRAEILLGGSYTFTEGTTVSAEYLYYGEGYDNDEADDFYALLNRSGEAFAYQGDDAARQQLAQLATRNLYYAQQSNLAFRRRHYVMLYANRDDLWDRLGVTGGVMMNANDQSFYAFANSSLKIVDALESFANILTYSRENDTEFHGLFDYMATVGLRWYF